MAVLEELIVSQLTSDATMVGLLAKYNGQPAVFEYRAADDKDPLWGTSQYPRVDYMVERREDPERKIHGVVMINVWDTTEASVTMEQVGAQVTTLLDGAMYHPDNEPIEGLRWSRTQFFTAGREQSDVSMSEMPPSDVTYGMYLEFDLIAFPLQTTYDPDPIAALTTWASGIVGIQSNPSSWTPTSGEPALYWRFESQQMVGMEPAVTWFDATIYGHVLGPQPQDRLNWTRKISEKLSLDRAVILSDGSPMYLQKLSADTKMDPLRIGQIKVIARYGVLVSIPAGTPIQHVYLNGKGM